MRPPEEDEEELLLPEEELPLLEEELLIELPDGELLRGGELNPLLLLRGWLNPLLFEFEGVGLLLRGLS